MDRKPVNGKGCKPPQHIKHSETFAFKAAVLYYKDTHKMQDVIRRFYPAIVLHSKAN